MATAFQMFSRLPAELRLYIWQEALLEACDTRTVVLYADRVLPLKHLISPLLSVNQESRVCAQAFYEVKLDVYTVPPFRSRIDWESVLDCAPHASFAREVLGRTALLELQRVEQTGCRTGKVYISPELDTLVMGYNCGSHFCIEGQPNIWAQERPGVEILPRCHISARLPAAACKEITSLVQIINPEWSLYGSRHFNEFVRGLDVVDVDEMTDLVQRTNPDMDNPHILEVFPNLRYQHGLSLDNQEYDDFLLKTIRSGGQQPYSTLRWYDTPERTMG